MTFGPPKRPVVEAALQRSWLERALWAMPLKDVAVRLGVSENVLGPAVRDLAREGRVRPPPERFWNVAVRIGYQAACLSFGVSPLANIGLPAFAGSAAQTTLAEARAWLARAVLGAPPSGPQGAMCPCCGQRVWRGRYAPVSDPGVPPTCPPPLEP